MFRSERTAGHGVIGSLKWWLKESGPEKDDNTEIALDSILGSNERLVLQLIHFTTEHLNI